MFWSRRRPRAVVSASVILAGAVLGLGMGHAAPVAALATAHPPRPSYFGSTEIENTRLDSFAKWTGMLARYRAEQAEAGAPCTPTPILPCYYHDWLAFLAGLKARPVMAQLDAVNRTMNRHRYVADSANWGVSDYWETPDEFFRKDGDCEDFAIVKYLSLRQLGFPAGRLRVVILQDLQRNMPHAALIVFVKGEAFLLDNQIPGVVPASAVHRYRPIYSINENAWWLHEN